MNDQIQVTLPIGTYTYAADIADSIIGLAKQAATRTATERGRAIVGHPRIDFPIEVDGMAAPNDVMWWRFTFDTEVAA